MQQQKQMPNDRAAEGAVIASMLMDNNMIAQVMEILTADDFYHEDIRCLFAGINELWGDEQVVDAIILRSHLNAQGKLSNEIIYKLLTSILDTVPGAANAVYYANFVKTKALQRQMIVAVEELSTDIWDELTTIEDKQAALEYAAMRLKIPDKTNIDIRTLVSQAMAFIERGENCGIETGFPLLDKKTNGFQRGDVVIIAGRPSMGKSSLALELAMNICEKQFGVVIFSMEMNPLSLVFRMISNRAAIPMSTIMKRYCTFEQQEKLQDAKNQIAEFRCFIDGEDSITPAQLTAKVMRLKAMHDIDVVLVDYLQLMRLGQKSENRQQEITKISAQIKNCARRTNTAIVVLCQLNRACEARAGHRPILSDLRESGSLEQDADLVLFLHRDDYYRQQQERGALLDNKAVCIVAKNRNGETGDVPLIWLPEYFSFKSESSY